MVSSNKFCSIILCCILTMPSLANCVSLKVRITGIDQKLTDEILTDLSLQNAITEPKLSANRIRNLYYLAPEQITETLQALGYYNATIEDNLTETSGQTDENNTSWIATFNITLGPATLIKNGKGEITGIGKNDPRLKKKLDTPKLKINKVLVHADYEDTKEKLLNDLHAIGYLQADFLQSVIAVNRQENTAEIKFVIDTKVQYQFGKVTFLGSNYPKEFLDRFIPFSYGQAYEVDKLMEFQQNLEQVDLFSKVRFDLQTDLQNQNNIMVPIEARLTQKPKNLYNGSIGYGTDTGFRATLGWLYRIPNTAGHKFQASTYLSTLISNARLSYIIPGSRPATDRYVITGLGQLEHFEGVFSRRAEVSGAKIIQRGRTESTYGLNYFTETFHIANQAEQNKKYLLPNAKWIWINSKERDENNYGTRFDFGIKAGLQGIISDNSVLQAELNAKRIQLLTNTTRFIVRGTAGAVASQSFTSLPPSLRFFTGGMNTVRGFAYNSLGPRAIPNDPDSDNLGGRYLIVGSVELEQRLYQDLSGVVFFDTGNASLTTNIPLAFGAGLGARYKTAIGNFRLDLAKPLNTVTNKHWRIHFNFGADL